MLRREIKSQLARPTVPTVFTALFRVLSVIPAVPCASVDLTRQVDPALPFSYDIIIFSTYPRALHRKRH
jgi:hypothetical protein